MALRNVTITLDEETARWARIEAARRDMSVSRLLAGLLEEHMHSEKRYERAMADFLSRKPARLKKRGATYPPREDLHDRAGLR